MYYLIRPTLLLCAVLGLSIGTALADQEPKPLLERVERQLGMMGTRLQLSFEAQDRASALAASELAVRELEAAEARLSTWGASSELARLNAAAPGFPFRLSPTLRRELTQAKECWKATRGAFDPGVGALFDAWGIRSGGRQPSETQIRKALQSGGMWALEINPSGAAIRKLPGLKIDESGFGKGAGLDRARQEIEREQPEVTGWIDLGGQWISIGSPRARPLTIAHPNQRQEPVIELSLKSGSVATSGNSERGLELGTGEHAGHILDPSTGQPSADFGSLTVVAPTALEADCLSTGLYVMGPQRALGWAKGHPGVEVLVLEVRNGDLTARATSGLMNQLTVLKADLPLTFIP